MFPSITSLEVVGWFWEESSTRDSDILKYLQS